MKYGRIFIYGDLIYKNNFVDVDEREETIILPKDVKSYQDCLKDDKTKFPLLYGDFIQDIGISEKRTCCINSNGIVIEAGQIIAVQPGEYYIYTGNSSATKAASTLQKRGCTWAKSLDQGGSVSLATKDESVKKSGYGGNYEQNGERQVGDFLYFADV